MTERKRLTKLLKEAFILADENYGMPNVSQVTGYLLANGVIVPPCKVDDKVYVIRMRNKKGKYVDTIVEKTVQSIEIGRNNWMWLKFGTVDGDSTNSTYITYEEAEKALKERKENA